MKTQLSLEMTRHLSHKFFWTMGIYLFVASLIFFLLLFSLFHCQEKFLNAFLVNYAHSYAYSSSPMKMLKTVSQIPSPTTFSHQPSCFDCHNLSTSPNSFKDTLAVNAFTFREMLQQMNWLLILSGISIVVLSILVMSWFLHYFVLRPVYQLLKISHDWQNGKLESRVLFHRNDELGALAQFFNHLTNKLQEALRTHSEQKNFFQSFIDAIPDGIRVIDKNYRVIIANKAYHQQLGLTVNSQQPCYTSSYGRQQPCSPTLMACPLHEINKTGQNLKKITEHLRGDGSKIQVEVCAAPMQVDLNGKMETFIVESVRDLTQTIQFSHEQKLASLGQLAAGIAHDIHNPLASIRLALQSTLRTLNASKPNLEDVHHDLALVDKQIDQCSAVTQRLLKLATPSGGQPYLVSLNEVIVDTLALIAFEGQEKSVTIHTSFANDLNYRVLAIESDIRMLIFNLVQNALNAMPQQGGKIDIQVYHQLPHLFITIKDTGIGIPSHLLSRIFEPFFSHRPDGRQKGSGLGLAICKSIVERYQGHISVTQSGPQGTQFLVTLPEAQ